MQNEKININDKSLRFQKAFFLKKYKSPVDFNTNIK